MECINEKCSGNNLKGECQYEKDFNCDARIEPTHTPTYAEEQLENAIEKEVDKYICFNLECYDNDKTGVCTRKHNYLCMDKIKEQLVLNYEEEYNKLKQENKELKAIILLRDLTIENRNSSIKKYKEESYDLKNEILHIKAINGGLTDKIETIDDGYQEEIKTLKEKISVLKYLEEVQEADNIDKEYYNKIEKENKNLKEIIKKLSELL